MGERRIVENPHRAGDAEPVVLDAPVRFHGSLPGYAATPLVDAPGVAGELGVERVWVKDESRRLGMPSFKILGASWASFRALCQHIGVDHDRVDGVADLGERLRPHLPLTLVAATDGNHGRAVARVATWLGLDAHILVPADMVPARIAAIEGEGARVTVVDGSYDDAIVLSAEQADQRRLVISDTSWPGYEQVPQWVIDGYATIALEVEGQLEERGAQPPTLVAAPIGVGAFAASVVQCLRRPGITLVGVEPTRSDCMLASIEAGRVVQIPGPYDSIMAGLNCGTPSMIAWPLVSHGMDLFCAVEDERAMEAMRMLAEAGVVAGESGAAGLAGALDLRDAGRLPADARILLVSTEGATDPVGYQRVVGRTPETVEAETR